MKTGGDVDERAGDVGDGRLKVAESRISTSGVSMTCNDKASVAAAAPILPRGTAENTDGESGNAAKESGDEPVFGRVMLFPCATVSLDAVGLSETVLTSQNWNCGG